MEYRAVYVDLMLAAPEWGRQIQSLWDGLVDNSPLRQFIEPNNCLGEAPAWGGPHITVLDALLVNDPALFDKMIKSIISRGTSPKIEIKGLMLKNNGALLVKCESKGLKKVRMELIHKTRPLLSRSPICDEEWQRAYWWIKSHNGPFENKNLEILDSARSAYIQYGSPAINMSRHFRLNFLVKLVRLLKSEAIARNSNDVGLKASEDLNRFFQYGEPSWYIEDYDVHTTIVSGIPLKDEADCIQKLEGYNKCVAPLVKQTLRDFHPAELTIMSENLQNNVSVSVYDWLTQSFVTETRPGFKVIDVIPFKKEANQ